MNRTGQIVAVIRQQSAMDAMRVSNRFYACLAQTEIEFLFIHSVTRRKAHQRRAQQAAEKTNGRKHEQTSNDSLDSGPHLGSRLWHLFGKSKTIHVNQRPEVEELHRAACSRFLSFRTSGGPPRKGVLPPWSRLSDKTRSQCSPRPLLRRKSADQLLRPQVPIEA